MNNIQKVFERIFLTFDKVANFIFGEIDLSIFSKENIIADILLLSILFYIIIGIIRKLNLSKIISASLILFVLLFFSYHFSLSASKIVIQGMLMFYAISIPLMFQREIRQSFEHLFKDLFTIDILTRKTINLISIREIKQASLELMEKKFGALIVIEQNTPLNVYSDTGTIINSKISKELLLSIFYPKSALHDGAVIISKNRIISAGSILPISTSNKNTKFGTRHKSAIGLSEVSDAIIIVISEEQGIISMDQQGKIKKNLNIEQMYDFLMTKIK